MRIFTVRESIALGMISRAAAQREGTTEEGLHLGEMGNLISMMLAEFTHVNGKEKTLSLLTGFLEATNRFEPPKGTRH